MSNHSSALARHPENSAMNRALAIIREEHHSLGVVLHEMQAMVCTARTSRVAIDCTPFKLMLDYIKTFPETLHHPKEDNYLFAKLARRTQRFDDVIAELREHHAAGDDWLNRLETALNHFEGGAPNAFVIFNTALDRFCDAQWQHMRMEENLILPAACKYLTAEDWKEIAEAFSQNGDPRFSPTRDKACTNMFAKIVRFSPAPDSEPVATA